MAMTGCDKRGSGQDSDGGGGGGIQSPTRDPGVETGGDVSGTESSTESAFELPDSSPQGSQGTQSGDVCESFDVDVRQAPTKLMMVLDKSGSMVKNTWDHDGNAGTAEVTRWFSLYEVVDQVTEKFNSSISFGAQLYPSAVATHDVALCSVAGMPEVPIAAGSRDAVMAALPIKLSRPATQSDSGPGTMRGATPTYDAYASALTHLRSVVAAAKADPNQKEEQPPAIVLITDGGANCANLDDAECLLKAGQPLPQSDPCIQKWFYDYDDRIHGAVEGALSEHEIKTYVIGIGIEDKESTSPPYVNTHVKLNDLADKGGTARPGGTTKYFSADNQQSLLAALDEIAASVRSCTVELQTAVPEARRDYVDLSIQGKVLTSLGNPDSCDGGVSGWRWDHSTTPYGAVELCGSACLDLKAVAAVDVVVGCEPPA